MSTRNIVHAQHLDADDLDVDGAPISSASNVLKMVSEKFDSVCDSGYLPSIGSAYGSMHSSLHEKKTETDSIETRLGGLTLETQKYTSTTEDAKYSIDDGYRSYQSQFESEDSCIQIKPEISPAVLELYNQDIDGDSQLHMAIINLMVPIALYIIQQAPSRDWLNLPNNMLQTPLHLSVMTRLPQVVKALIDGGADIEARDSKGDTPLHIACREGFDDIAQILLNSKASQEVSQDLEARNYDGQACLHLAAENTHLPIIRLLVLSGANLNTQDGKSGKTVIHYAAESGNTLLLEFLLQYPSVNIQFRTYSGLTAIMLADGRGYSDIVYQLQKFGGLLENVTFEESSDSDEDMS